MRTIVKCRSTINEYISILYSTSTIVVLCARERERIKRLHMDYTDYTVHIEYCYNQQSFILSDHWREEISCTVRKINLL